MAIAKTPHATLESGHRVIPQYLGIHSVIADPRSNPRTRRAMSAEDDPARAAFVEQVKQRYRKDEFGPSPLLPRLLPSPTHRRTASPSIAPP